MKFIKDIYLNKIVFLLLGICVVIFCLGLFQIVFMFLGQAMLLAVLIGTIIEIILLKRSDKPIDFQRKLPNRLSNSDNGQVVFKINNNLPFRLLLTIYEDLPYQLQIRDWYKEAEIQKFGSLNESYEIRPTLRGQYLWQNSYVFIRLPFVGLVSRKLTFEDSTEVPCYPSFEQFNKIPVQAIANNFQESSQNTIRKIGQSLEYEQIKEYVTGDNYRHINWKASAKKGTLMVNQYQDEKSQDIYCVIDMGRAMQMPFNELTLLDYSINASLALSKAVITMGDKAGVLAFSHNKCDFLPAKKDFKQFGKINDFLYNLTSNYSESNFELLYKFSRVHLKNRSLLVIFTNFNSINSLHRQLPYLKALSKYHLLQIIFFENAELENFTHTQALNLNEVYEKTIAQNFLLQNRLIVRELTQVGIQSFFCQPQKLSLEAINHYVSIKKRQIL